MTTNRTERATVRIPRCEANWIAVVRLAPVIMPAALDEVRALAATIPIPVVG